MRLLVTRPLPDGERTAETLRQRGHDAVVAPVLRTEFIAAPFGPGPYAGIVFTSANAVRALQSHSDRGEVLALPAFAVGARTAEAAAHAGFSETVSAEGDVADLAALLAKRFAGTDGRLLYLAGQDRAGDLARSLAAHAIKVETVVVYRTLPDEGFPETLRVAFAAAPPDGVLHYSRRSAAAFLAGAEAAGLREAALAADHFCLSSDVAAVLATAGARSVKIAGRPNELSLLALLNKP